MAVGSRLNRYWVCAPCVDKIKSAKLRQARDPKGKVTCLLCEPGGSFLVQLPHALKAPTDSTAGAESLPNTSFESFTVTLELQLDALPPAAQYLSLLRFAEPQSSRSRRRNIAHAFINDAGKVVARTTTTTEQQLVAPAGGVLYTNFWHTVSVAVNSQVLGSVGPR